MIAGARRAHVALAAVALGLPACSKPTPACRDLARSGAAGALAVCEAEYAHTRSPAAGASLASLYVSAGRLDEGMRLARTLVDTDQRGVALRVVGIVASRRGTEQDALAYLEEARSLHRAAGDRANLARDDVALAGALWSSQRHRDALVVLDETLVEATATRDDRLIGYAHLLAADVLGEIGYLRAAEAELAQAEPRMAPADTAWLQFKRGVLARDLRRYQAAAAAFERTLAAHPGPDIELATHLGLAHALTRLERFDDAERELAVTDRLDRAGAMFVHRLRLRGVIAAHRGERGEAKALFEQAYQRRGSEDWGMELALELARLALHDDPTIAERWLRTAVEHAERALRSQTAVELRPWILSDRRAPYDLLFALLAGQGRAAEALAVWDLVQGRALWDLMIDGRRDAVARDEITLRADALRVALPRLAEVPAAAREPAPALMARLAGHDVLAIAATTDAVWSAIIIDGRPQLRRAGSLDELHADVERLRRDPGDLAAADRLGAALIPEMAAGHRPLEIVLDARLRGLPLAALRRLGRLLVGNRALIQVSSLSAVGCESAGESTPPAHRGITAIGDPLGDLFAARREVAWLGLQYGATVRIGADAVRATLDTSEGDVLHVATHASLSGGVAALRFADGMLGADEIALHRTSPRLVVLAACESGIAGDDDQLGALSSAFLIAGARHVVATVKPVADEGAAALMRGFYEHGGTDHPVAALAAAQQDAAAAGSHPDWAFFAVYQRAEPCPRPGEGRSKP